MTARVYVNLLEDIFDHMWGSLKKTVVVSHGINHSQQCWDSSWIQTTSQIINSNCYGHLLVISYNWLFQWDHFTSFKYNKSPHLFMESIIP